MDITLADEIADVLTVGALRVDAARVVAHDASLDAPLAEAEGRLRVAAGHGETIAAVRRLYRAVGLDPTKTRPSSEALLRRIRKGGGLPRINSVVDVGNWCSVETQLPFGLYDVDRRELKDNLSSYIRRVEAGERVAVTAHGRVVAGLVPPGARAGHASTSRWEELIGAGVLHPPAEAGDPFGTPNGSAALPAEPVAADSDCR